MGYSKATENQNKTSLIQANQDFVLKSVNCYGNEKSILDCNYLIGSDCKSNQPVTVDCSNL